MTTRITLSLYYEHKALRICDHETLHTHVVKNITIVVATYHTRNQ